jgi:ABC-type lipoprotein export system ATPase subunit
VIQQCRPRNVKNGRLNHAWWGWRAGFSPDAISGSQQQSAAIARALANDPPILIADEPTGNLDSQTADQVLAIFDRLAGQGKTILMVTHDRSLAQRTGRTLVIADGPWWMKSRRNKTFRKRA